MPVDKAAIKQKLAELEREYEAIKHKYRFQHIYSYDKPEYDRVEKEMRDGIAECKRLLKSL